MGDRNRDVAAVLSPAKGGKPNSATGRKRTVKRPAAVGTAVCLLLGLCACAPGTAVKTPAVTADPASMAISTPTTPTAVPAPAPTDPFDVFLSGDFSVLEPEVQEYAPIIFLGSESCWEYVFLDLDSDGADELFLRWDSNTAIFHEEDGVLFCWGLDTMEMTCYRYPLTDATVVEQYDYGGGSTFSLYRYHTDGSTESGDNLYIRRETIYPDDARPCPYYEWNGAEVSREEFERVYQEYIGGRLVNDWEPWQLSK